LVEGIGLDGFSQSVFVFRAPSRDGAFVRALELGRDLEATYPNADGKEVRWRLSAVLTLDELSGGDPDGAEVYSEPFVPRPEEVVPFDTMFHPENSQPLPSGIN
jgi:hypothetical protein